MVDAYILVQTEVGKTATATASVRRVPGVSEAASVVGPYDVIARVRAQNMDALAKLVISQVQPLDGVARTISCAIVRLLAARRQQPPGRRRAERRPADGDR